jgi:Pyridoxamine 5''-phosphate oxidase.
MKTFDDKMKTFLNENTWFLATCNTEGPHIAPYGFKMVLTDGRMAIAQIFMTDGCKNIQENGKAEIAVVAASGEAYRFNGTASYISEGEEVEAVKEMVKVKSAAMAAANPNAPQRERVVHGAVLFIPEEITVISPGPANKQKI